MPKRVLSVGHCDADHGTITRAIEQHFGAEVVPAAGAEEALARLRAEPFALALVNRVFDADAFSGLDFIKQVRADEALRSVSVMLVSNYADYQRLAVEAGAVPGFGKAAIGQPQMIARLRAYLE
jgi:CheY-like chemotaxis protein